MIIPSFIDNTNFKYVIVDGKYVSTLIISDFPKQIDFLQVMEDIPKSCVYDMSIFVNKQNTVDVLKEITNYISNTSSEIKMINDNQLDFEIMKKYKDDARLLRKEIQINNQEIYFINIYITFYSSNLKKLIKNQTEFRIKLFSKRILSNIANFRQLQCYLANLPFNNISNNFLKSSYRNITTDALVNFFPFYNKTIFDKNGIIFGFTKDDNKIFNINIFNENYLNSNICILGSSGAGKSFFTKICIIRHLIMNVYQYILDIEDEYETLVVNLNGQILDVLNKTPNFYYNILEFINVNENCFVKKIKNITKLFSNMYSFTEKQSVKFEGYLKILYKKYNITEDINSLYVDNVDNLIYINKKIKQKSEVPSIKEILNIIDDEDIKNKVNDFVINYPIFCNKTNIDIENHLILFKIKEITETTSYLVKYILTDIIDEIFLKLKNKNKIIYIDEVWKYINNNYKSKLSSYIFNLYKTIRKKRGSICTITQDISDFFHFENGSYGKSILNNSSFKIFFKFDFSDMEILKKLSVLNDKIINQILRLDKKQMILSFKNNSKVLDVKVIDYEKNIIENNKEYEYENNSST